VYNDAGISRNSDIYTWSGADFGLPAGSFEANSTADYLEGTNSFRTTSGAGATNYAGWGVFLVKPADHTTDLTGYPQLKFAVKSSVDLRVEIQLEGKSGPKYAVQASAFGWTAVHASLWQDVEIPASAFSGANLRRVFSPFLVTVSGSSLTFYVDNVRWTN
jgi:hypothetical protein